MRNLIIRIFEIFKMIFEYFKRRPFLLVLVVINVFFYWYLTRIQRDKFKSVDYKIVEEYGGWYIEALICRTEDYGRDGSAILDCDYETITDDLGSENNALKKLAFFKEVADKKLERDDFLKISKFIDPILLRYLIHILSFFIWLKVFYHKK
jgi:hypothetical protein